MYVAMKIIKNDVYFDNDEEIIKEYEILKNFKSYNILKERIDLYKDFTINLLYILYDSYLGIEYIKTKKDATGHYNWCYGKILDQFNDQEIDFYGNNLIYDYFLKFYLDQFYSEKKQESLNYYVKFWSEIFEHKKNNKKKNDFDVLLEIYQKFNTSLENKIEIPHPN